MKRGFTRLIASAVAVLLMFGVGMSEAKSVKGKPTVERIRTVMAEFEAFYQGFEEYEKKYDEKYSAFTKKLATSDLTREERARVLDCLARVAPLVTPEEEIRARALATGLITEAELQKMERIEMRALSSVEARNAAISYYMWQIRSELSLKVNKAEKVAKSPKEKEAVAKMRSAAAEFEEFYQGFEAFRKEYDEKTRELSIVSSFLPSDRDALFGSESNDNMWDGFYELASIASPYKELDRLALATGLITEAELTELQCCSPCAFSFQGDRFYRWNLRSELALRMEKAMRPLKK